MLRRVHGGVRPLHPEPHRELRGRGRGVVVGAGVGQVAAQALQAAQRPAPGAVEGRGGHGDAAWPLLWWWQPGRGPGHVRLRGCSRCGRRCRGRRLYA